MASYASRTHQCPSEFSTSDEQYSESFPRQVLYGVSGRHTHVQSNRNRAQKTRQDSPSCTGRSEIDSQPREVSFWSTIYSISGTHYLGRRNSNAILCEFVCDILWWFVYKFYMGVLRWLSEVF